MKSSRNTRLALTAIVLAAVGGTISSQTWELARVITVDSPIPEVLPPAPIPVAVAAASLVMPAAYSEEPTPELAVPAKIIPPVDLQAPPVSPEVGSPPAPESSSFRPRSVQIHAVSTYDLDRRRPEPVAVRPVGMQLDSQPDGTIPRRRPMSPLRPTPDSPTAAQPRAEEPRLEAVPPAPRVSPPATLPEVIPYGGWLPSGDTKGIGRVKRISDVTIDTDPPREVSAEGDPLGAPADLAADALANVPPYDRGNVVGAPWSAADVAPFGFCYQPLYFEEAWLERYGYGYGLWQPAVSVGHFYGNVALFPVKSFVNPPRRCTKFDYPVLPGTYGLCN